MTYTVSSGTLNPSIPYHTIPVLKFHAIMPTNIINSNIIVIAEIKLAFRILWKNLIALVLTISMAWRTKSKTIVEIWCKVAEGNQELLVVKDKVGRPPRWAWGKQVHGMWYFSLQCFDIVGWATGRASCLYKKKLGVALLVVMIWLELCTTYSSSCHHHFHHPLLQ